MFDSGRTKIIVYYYNYAINKNKQFFVPYLRNVKLIKKN